MSVAAADGTDDQPLRRLHLRGRPAKPAEAPRPRSRRKSLLQGPTQQSRRQMQSRPTRNRLPKTPRRSPRTSRLPTRRSRGGTDKPALVLSQVFVKPGRRNEGMVEIVEGLKAGDEVVTAGQNRLFNGMSVAVDNTIDPSKSANKQADQQ